MKIQLNKNKIIILNLILLIVIIILSVVIFYIHTLVLESRQLVSERVDHFNHSLNLKQYSEDDLLSTIKQRQNINDYLDSLIVNGNEIVEFFNFLENLASESAVSLDIDGVKTSNDYTVDEVSAELGTVSINLKIKGSKTGVVKFLSLLENSPYVLETKSLDLKRSGNNWEMNMSFKAVSN